MVKEIKFRSMEDAKNFISKTTNCPFDVDLISGRYVIDAKSIMGVLSLDFDLPMKVKIHNENCDDYLYSINKWIVK